MKLPFHPLTQPYPKRPDTPWSPYLNSFAMIVLVTLLVQFFHEHELINIVLLYQLPVILSAFWWGRWPSYFTAFISMLVFDFLFIPPTFTLSVDDVRYIWSFITFLLVAFIIGGRTESLRNEASTASQRERSTAALYQFSQEIAADSDLNTIIQKLALQVSDTLGQKTRVILPNESGQLAIRAEHTPSSKNTDETEICAVLSETESAAARWSYASGHSAGRTSDHFPATEYLYLPMIAQEFAVGLLAVHVDPVSIEPEQRQLLEAWAGLAAIAIERIRLMEKQQEASLLLESDKLRTALLNSVSHELRTPLASIIGSVSTLLESEMLYSQQDRHELLLNIQDGANRMDRVVANLLDSARLESGMVHLKLDWCDLEDVIGTALRRLREAVRNRDIKFAASSTVPMLRADSVLLEQVLINLLDNALKYSPSSSSIEINLVTEADKIIISVADRGLGIPLDELPHIFDKFYRIRLPAYRVDGTGLGLSICKGIIEAHGGEIWAENRPGGGAIMKFSLPASPEQTSPTESR